MSQDDETLRFYAEQAASYAARLRSLPRDVLDAFLDGLPSGARILDFGCGGGQDTAYMLKRGFDVLPADASRELAAEAEKLIGRPVEIMRFHQLDLENVFYGVWASASLLHVPVEALCGILARIYRALKPKGRFWASYKAGERAGRDRFGRYYNYMTADALRRHYSEAADWRTLEIISFSGTGYDRQPTDWHWVKATA